MATEAVDTVHAEHILFVTGPQRELLLEHFSALFRGHDDVEVLMDRRRGERRRDPRGPAGGERRRQDRRRRSPEWVVPPLGAV